MASPSKLLSHGFAEEARSGRVSCALTAEELDGSKGTLIWCRFWFLMRLLVPPWLHFHRWFVSSLRCWYFTGILLFSGLRCNQFSPYQTGSAWSVSFAKEGLAGWTRVFTVFGFRLAAGDFLTLAVGRRGLFLHVLLYRTDTPSDQKCAPASLSNCYVCGFD